MRACRILSELLQLKQTRVRDVAFDDDGLVAEVAPTLRVPRCGGCGNKARRIHDERPRFWRHLDLAGMMLKLRYVLRRVRCRRCGVIAEEVPWAERGSGFTRPFEEFVAYLTQRADKTTVSTLLRTAWRTVGRVVARVVERLGPADRLDGLTHIGVDELSYRRHHEYVTVVVDHLTSRVVWVHPGKNADTLKLFFQELGHERATQLEAVTIDMSGAYIKAVSEATPQAQIIFDRFHVQRLAHDALDEVRREQVRELKGTDEAAELKNTRFALQKNPWNLTLEETEKLSTLEKTNEPLYRAYLLKESLARILDGRQQHVARRRLLEWIDWAQYSDLAPFQKAAGTILAHLDGIVAYVASGLNNGRVEGLNGKVRAITRRAYGFHDPHSLIGLIFLCCSGLDLTPPHAFPSAPLTCQ
jgi:transposase